MPSAPPLVATEAELLRGLRNQFRVIATPLPAGAVLQDAVWKDLWGSVIVWIGGCQRPGRLHS